LFNKEYIFNDFVDFLYELKNNSESGTPDYIISKLLMNSLYGRLGMNPEMEKHLIVSDNEISDYEDKFLISNVIPLDNNKNLISFFNGDIPESEI
jgi:hypothetical protein